MNIALPSDHLRGALAVCKIEAQSAKCDNTFLFLDGAVFSVTILE